MGDAQALTVQTRVRARRPSRIGHTASAQLGKPPTATVLAGPAVREPAGTMSERKAVIKNADMSEEMQQEAIDVSTQARQSSCGCALGAGPGDQSTAALAGRTAPKQRPPPWCLPQRCCRPVASLREGAELCACALSCWRGPVGALPSGRSVQLRLRASVHRMARLRSRARGPPGAGEVQHREGHRHAHQEGV